MAPSRSSSYSFSPQYLQVKKRVANSLTRHRKRGRALCVFGWQGSGTACDGDPLLSADLAGRGGKIKDSEVNGGPLANRTFLNRVVSQKNTWGGFFCEIITSFLYPILLRSHWIKSVGFFQPDTETPPSFYLTGCGSQKAPSTFRGKLCCTTEVTWASPVGCCGLAFVPSSWQWAVPALAPLCGESSSG